MNRCGKNKSKTRILKIQMKNILTRSLFLLSLASFLVVPSRRAAAQSDQDLIEVARSVVAADRKAVLVKEMGLSEEESKNFWPLYEEYRQAMDKVNDELMTLVLEYGKLYPIVPEEKARQMLDTYTRIQEKQVKERSAYLKKFTRVLPASKALRLAQLETRFDSVVQLNLAARVPLVPLPAGH